MKRTIAVMFNVVCACTPVLAEDSCGDVLKFGIWNTRETSNFEKNSRQIANWACNASNQSGGGSFGYGPVKVEVSEGGGNSACSSNKEGYTLEKGAYERVQTVAEAL